MNLRSSVTFRYASEAAPAVTILLLLVLPMLLPNRAVIDEGLVQRQREIAASMEDVPFTIGDWVGSRVEVPAVAFELLHPNAILSRQYMRLPRGPQVSVVMVHCSDLRDMRGHYPPVCYPANGWMAMPETGRSGVRRSLELDSSSVPVREYRYARSREHGQQAGIRILNFFVLPDGTLSHDMDDIDRQSERLAVSTQGACQVQVITALDLPLADAVQAAESLLSGFRPLFIKLGVAEELNDVQ